MAKLQLLTPASNPFRAPTADANPITDVGKVQAPANPKPRVDEADLPAHDSTKTVGNIASKEQLPTIAVVGKYPSAKSSSPAAQLLDKGFAMDQVKESGKALAQYEKAGVALRSEIAKALGDKLTATGLSPEDFKALPAYAEPMIFGHLARNNLFQELPATLQETTLKYFNRTGLAHKHEGNLGMAAISCGQAITLNPKYGPAHYNLACATLKMESANGPTDVGARNKEVLDSLERALAADKGFFTKLALSDPDFNTLRSDARFRSLVGLPALPEAANAQTDMPTQPVLATYPSSPASKGAATLIDEAFALDRNKESAKAVAAYEAALPSLRDEIGLALDKKGLDSSKVRGSDSKTGLMVALGKGVFDRLDPALQETTLKFFNRLGLANKHEGDLTKAATYCAWSIDLKPNYGPGLYNFACITLQDSDPNNKYDRAIAEKATLEHLGMAIKADPAFFTKLALSDPDLNALRDDPRFKALLAASS